MNSITPTRWKVAGMDCPSCVRKIETAIRRLPGATEVSVNLLAGEMTARLDGTDPALIETTLSGLGFTATRTPERQRQANTGAHTHDHAGVNTNGAWWQDRNILLVAGLIAVLLVTSAAGFALPALSHTLYTAVAVLMLLPFGRRAIALARAGSPFSIETLTCTAAIGAIVIGAAEEAAVVLLLFAIGEVLEGLAARRARSGIAALMNLIPHTALAETADGVREIALDQLRPDMVLHIRPGDRVPADGTIIEGASALDESPVTGESIPVQRGAGETVIAGSINTDALLRVRTTHVGSDNTIGRIIHMVEEASASRAPTQRFVERFARWWTPGAMLVSIVVMVAPPLLSGAAWETWIYRGLAVLLIACPCALVISVPAAMASGLSAGARRGLLVKGGAALEGIGQAVTIAFDKTGTLTEGRPRVTDVVPVDASNAAGLLAEAAAVEQGSSHPLGRAILDEAASRNVDIPPARNAGAVAGKAVRAEVNGREVIVCSPRHAAELGVTVDAHALETQGKTTVAVLSDGVHRGLIAMRDEPRADAADAMAALKALGVAPVMLSGDNARTAKAIGDVLGLEARAELLPDGKLREIAALQAKGPVVMVGDGINDAPALAAASVGIAIGTGTDVALETADAALIRPRIMGVADLVRLSRDTLANVKQNVAIAVGLKLVFLLTTLTGYTGLWMAILADTGATVLVTINALRLLRWR